jgi:uncharacterized protein
VLEVTVYRDDRDHIAGISARGHADFADYGEDIVCAAVSAILQAARLGLAEYARIDLAVRQEPGKLELSWADGLREDLSVAAITATAELAVEQIARRYPEHVRLNRANLSPGAGG